MALRFLLVSLVAGMGLELPSGQEVSSWTRSGREWVGARWDQLASIRVEAERTFLGSTDCERAAELVGPAEVSEPGASTADLAFDVVVEGMASAFAADLVATRPEDTGSALPPEAFADHPGGKSLPALAWNDPEPAPFPASDEASAVNPALTIGTPSMAGRADRLSAAVRLTRQAVIAWASLIEGSSEILTDSR